MWARKVAMYADKAEQSGKRQGRRCGKRWSEDDDRKLESGLENIKANCKIKAKDGIRCVSFVIVGPVLGFSLCERSTLSLQTEEVKHKVSSYFFTLGLRVQWSLEPFRDLWVVTFPKTGNHVHLGKACDVWKATLSW